MINQRTEINKFSFKRVMHLVKYEASDYIWWLIPLTLVGVFLTYILDITILYSVNKSTIDYSYFLSFVFLTVFFPMIVLKNVFPQKKFVFDLLEKNDNYLLLPASSFEKYLSKLIGIFVIGGTIFSLAAIYLLLVYSSNIDVTGFLKYLQVYKTMIVTVYAVFSVFLLLEIFNYNLFKSNISKTKKTIIRILSVPSFFAIMSILTVPFHSTALFSSTGTPVFSFIFWFNLFSSINTQLYSLFVIASPIALIIGYKMWQNLEGVCGRYD